jgi:hypothetical protein
LATGGACKNKKIVKRFSALTPALSPRRGAIERRVLSHATSWGVVRLMANDTKPVTATRIVKISSDMTILSLSLGERAGVRASASSNSTKDVEESIKL